MAGSHHCVSAAPFTDPDGRVGELLRALRRQMNGAVSETMHALGADYPVNYGVAVAAIRAAAAPYSPDDALARELYVRPERESRISATYISDPLHVTAADAVFWAAGIINSEMAEHAALLLGRSPVVQPIMEQWLATDSQLLRYAALLAGARAVQMGTSLDIPRLLPLIHPGGARMTPGSALTDRAAAAFIGRLWNARPACRPQLEPFLKEVDATRPGLWSQLEWQLEQDL